MAFKSWTATDPGRTGAANHDAVFASDECGVYAVVAPADDPGPGCDEWCAVPGVAGAWVFADERRAVTLAWCDDDPLAVASRVGSLVPARAELAGPFATVMPGEWDWFD